LKKSFNIQELLHGKSKRHETKLMHPSSLSAFQRDQECDLKHPDLVDFISTKQNIALHRSEMLVFKPINIKEASYKRHSKIKQLLLIDSSGYFKILSHLILSQLKLCFWVKIDC
jgi:hypothetical protein